MKNIGVILTKNVLLALVGSCLVAGCAKNLDSTSVAEEASVDKPSTVLSAIDSAVTGLGQGMNGSTASGKIAAGLQAQTSEADSKCDDNATPIDSLGNQLSQNDADYPARVFYCKLVKNTGSPDSVRGAYALVRNISCALEKAGLQFDGQPHQMQPVLGLDCFTQQQLDQMNQGPLTVTVTASKPAAFNNYYDSGIEMQVPSFGTFKLAVKKTAGELEFLTMEDQTVISANKTGAYAAYFNKTTGELRFENRSDRFSCVENGSCRWSRHERLRAILSIVNDQIVGVNGFQGIASEIYDNAGSYYGRISTLKGEMSTGLKSRFYQVGTGNSNDLADATQYAEISNSQCYTRTSDQGDCSANAGIQLTASGLVPFTLHPTAAATSVSDWANTVLGLTFTAVDFSDVQ